MPIDCLLIAMIGFPDLGKCIGLEVLEPLHMAGKEAEAQLLAAECLAAPVEFCRVDFMEVCWEADNSIDNRQ